MGVDNHTVFVVHFHLVEEGNDRGQCVPASKRTHKTTSETGMKGSLLRNARATSDLE
jgi:hypothetical protein